MNLPAFSQNFHIVTMVNILKKKFTFKKLNFMQHYQFKIKKQICLKLKILSRSFFLETTSFAGPFIYDKL